MRPGSSDPKSTSKPSTPSPNDTPLSPEQQTERDLFARMAKVKQYPIAPDPQTPKPLKKLSG